jgi:hypothetical protein
MTRASGMARARDLLIAATAVVTLGGGCLTEEVWDQHNPPPSTGCTNPGETRCDDSSLQTCTEGAWSTKSCPDVCAGLKSTFERCGPALSSPTRNICHCKGVSDPCQGVTCSGHGSCSNGTCNCNQGFADTGVAGCARCAMGYTGYPNCKKTSSCDCSSTGQTQCYGDWSIKTCKDGCHLTQQSCSSACGSKKSSGCAYSMDDKKDLCWCHDTHEIILFNVVNKCSNKTQTFQVFDTADNKQWTSTTLPYNVHKQEALACKAGNKLCWGAWVSGTYWGCGQSCQKTCSSCCYTCGSQLVVEVKLDC